MKKIKKVQGEKIRSFSFNIYYENRKKAAIIESRQPL